MVSNSSNSSSCSIGSSAATPSTWHSNITTVIVIVIIIIVIHIIRAFIAIIVIIVIHIIQAFIAIVVAHYNHNRVIRHPGHHHGFRHKSMAFVTTPDCPSDFTPPPFFPSSPPAQVSKDMALVPAGCEWRSLRRRCVPWTKAQCLGIAEAWQRALGEATKQVVLGGRFTKGRLLRLKAGHGRPSHKDISNNAMWIKGPLKAHPKKPCSAFKIADSLLILDEQWSKMLFDEKTRDRDALREGGRIRKLWSAVRILFRSTARSHDAAIMELKSMMKMGVQDDDSDDSDDSTNSTDSAESADSDEESAESDHKLTQAAEETPDHKLTRAAEETPDKLVAMHLLQDKAPPSQTAKLQKHAFAQEEGLTDDGSCCITQSGDDSSGEDAGGHDEALVEEAYKELDSLLAMELEEAVESDKEELSPASSSPMEEEAGEEEGEGEQTEAEAGAAAVELDSASASDEGEEKQTEEDALARSIGFALAASAGAVANAVTREEPDYVRMVEEMLADYRPLDTYSPLEYDAQDYDPCGDEQDLQYMQRGWDQRERSVGDGDGRRGEGMPRRRRRRR